MFLRFITVVGSGVMAGGQLFVLRAIIPAMRGWERRMNVRGHQDLLTYRAHNYLSVVAITTIVTGVVLLLLDTGNPRHTVFDWEWPDSSRIGS